MNKIVRKEINNSFKRKNIINNYELGFIDRSKFIEKIIEINKDKAFYIVK